MHIVIMGCGRVGATLARTLDRIGHDVAVIDTDPTAFRRLGTEFEGRTVTGVGFDRDTLIAAGIKDAYAFAAVSSGDNSNILAARVARETFGVEHVAARIYDPHRAEVYQRLGISTVATVRWSADQMIQRLLPESALPEFTDPSGKVLIGEFPLERGWVGRRLTELERVTRSRVAFVTRAGDGLIPGPETICQDGDLVHLAVDRSRAREVGAICSAPPPAD